MLHQAAQGLLHNRPCMCLLAPGIKSVPDLPFDCVHVDNDWITHAILALCLHRALLPVQALLDTVLVLVIVAVTGTLLFGLNVVLADAGQWWYSL